MTDLDHITEHNPMEANLVNGGAAFRVEEPRPQASYVVAKFNNYDRSEFPNPPTLEWLLR